MANEDDEQIDGPEWDGDFDADRARNLITKLRGEVAAAKAGSLTADQQQMLDEYQMLRDASQTDIERMQSELDTAKEAAGQVPNLTAQNLRLQVALDKGLTAKQASRLQGATKEELESDADELLKLFTPNAQGAEGLRPNPAQGTSGGGSAPSLEDQIKAADKAGDVKLSLQLKAQQLSILSHN